MTTPTRSRPDPTPTQTIQVPPTGVPSAAVVEDGRPTLPSATRRVLAVARIAIGAVFLWAFLDKTFGLGFATPAARAWIRGGSPTRGFLSSSDVGPLTGVFHALAGAPVIDALFMLALLGVGLACVAGIGLRIAAVAGTVLMLGMWAAEWPPARFTLTGEASGSSNPLVDYHLVYAFVLIVVALLGAGATWGLSRRWRGLALVQRWPWLW